MKRLLLAIAFATTPIAASAVFAVPASAAATLTELGDLSALRSIASDALALTAAGDLSKAATRITDFESAWDANAAQLRALSADKWGVIDGASDAAIASLRATNPIPAEAVAALTALLGALDNPSATPAKVGEVTAITDANGRALPCEDLLAKVRATAAASDADKPKFDALQAKGIERCNADDDKRADEFFAQALALMGA
jgi:hypothetical protein